MRLEINEDLGSVIFWAMLFALIAFGWWMRP
jgi:hypothetical protein